jgi:prevent-host-death family protein
METIVSATELARRLGDYLARVRYRRESLLVEKNGKPVARVVPAEDPSAVTLAHALAIWSSSAAGDAKFAADLRAVAAADKPPSNRWGS